MKHYCTQNNGGCSTCSLVSYGRDCRNNPLFHNLRKNSINLPEYQWQYLEDRALDVTAERRKKTSMGDILREMIDADIAKTKKD